MMLVSCAEAGAITRACAAMLTLVFVSTSVPASAADHAAGLVWFTESRPRVASESMAAVKTSASRQSLVGLVSKLCAQ